MEKRLQSLETRIARLWPTLANGFVDLESESIRKAIALYVSVQYLRHPDRRDSVAGFRKRMIDLLKNHPRDSNGRLLVRTRVQLGYQVFWIDPDELHQIEHAGPEIDTKQWIVLIQRAAIEFAEMLMKKRWSVVFIDEPLFVTSDYPLYVATPEFARHQLGAHDAAILFPLSPTRILCFDSLDVPGNGYHKVQLEAADMYNLLTWVNTESFMISGRDVYDVLLGIQRIRHELEVENNIVR